MTGEILSCVNPECNKEFYRERKEIKKVNESFCSNSCAAKFYNRLRASRLPLNICRNPDCSLPIPRTRKYCSPSHWINTGKLTDEEFKNRILKEIKAFFRKYGRVPLKREKYGRYRDARRLFGAWNKAIEAAGLKPNPVMFAKKYTANDGHKCDSLAEKIIDDWLYSHEIKHQRNTPYPNSPYTADFLIKGRFVEFFGLNGELKEYDKNMRLKGRLAKKYKLNLIKIYPKDLFPVNRLSEIIRN